MRAALRRSVLLHWASWLLGLVIAAALFPAVTGAAVFAAVFVAGFGAGTFVLARAVADDYNALVRHVRAVEQVNQRLASRARRRSRG